MPVIRLIVGLANPGAEYADTRHNAGAWYLSRLAQHYRVMLRPVPRFSAHVAQLSWRDQQLYLLIPTTFMNLSGHAVAKFAHFHRISACQILIAHDELDLPPGVVRFKQNGGHAGHNGLRDIIQQLQQHTDFYRLRIGIGHPGIKSRVTGHVLGRASATEQAVIDRAIDQAIAATEPLLQHGVASALHCLQQLQTQ